MGYYWDCFLKEKNEEIKGIPLRDILKMFYEYLEQEKEWRHYTIKARYYANNDQFGETYVITSDNSIKNTEMKVGSKMAIKQTTKGQSNG